VTLGSRGDVQPYVALGKAVQSRGHDVTVCTHANFASFVGRNGLKFADSGGDVLGLIGQEESREWMETGLNPFKFVSGFRRLMEKELDEGARAVMQACADAEAIIGSGTGFYSGYAVAQVKNIPFMQAYVQPVHPTWEFPSALFPTSIKGGAAFNFMTHWIGGLFFWQSLRPVVNRVRREFFHLKPISPLLGPIVEMDFAKIPTLYGLSPNVIAKPKNWQPWHHVTGYWFLDEPDWQPPREMLQFINAGDAPVCVGFGSMSDTTPERTSAIVLEAIKQSGQRAILLTGWGGLKQSQLSESIFVIEQAPHSWLFPRCKAIVHHGGSGTSGAAFRSGAPVVVVPFFGDQPFWAEIAKGLGVGTYIHRKDLTVEALARAINLVTEDEGIRKHARELGEKIRDERGAETAAKIFDDWILQNTQNSS